MNNAILVKNGLMGFTGILLLSIFFGGCRNDVACCTEPSLKATDVHLKGLTVSAGALNPAFDSLTLGYTLSVPNDTRSIIVTPRVSSSDFASISVNGMATPSGTPSRSILLAVGSNTISIAVSSESGNPNTYTVIVNRAKNENADLSGLSFTNGLISPVFDSATLEYTITVPSTSVTPNASAFATSSITVNGLTVLSGKSSGELALIDGANIIPIVVTSESGVVKTYTVTVNKSTPFNQGQNIKLGAQGSPILSSALDLDFLKPMNSSLANAEQEAIDLVFLVYANAFHMDNAFAARAAGIANSINLTNTFDSARVKDVKIVKASAMPIDQEQAKAAFSAGTASPSNVMQVGDIYLVMTTGGKLAIVTISTLVGMDNRANADFIVTLITIPL